MVRVDSKGERTALLYPPVRRGKNEKEEKDRGRTKGTIYSRGRPGPPSPFPLSEPTGLQTGPSGGVGAGTLLLVVAGGPACRRLGDDGIF